MFRHCVVRNGAAVDATSPFGYPLDMSVDLRMSSKILSIHSPVHTVNVSSKETLSSAQKDEKHAVVKFVGLKKVRQVCSCAQCFVLSFCQERDIDAY